jgi:hypothetical protein
MRHGSHEYESGWSHLSRVTMITIDSSNAHSLL